MARNDDFSFCQLFICYTSLGCYEIYDHTFGYVKRRREETKKLRLELRKFVCERPTETSYKMSTDGPIRHRATTDSDGIRGDKAPQLGRFSKLPPEIRVQIYEYLYEDLRDCNLLIGSNVTDDDDRILTFDLCYLVPSAHREILRKVYPRDPSNIMLRRRDETMRVEAQHERMKRRSFLSLPLTCQSMYHETIGLLYAYPTFCFNELHTLYHFTQHTSAANLGHLSSLVLCIDVPRPWALKRWRYIPIEVFTWKCWNETLNALSLTSRMRSLWFFLRGPNAGGDGAVDRFWTAFERVSRLRLKGNKNEVWVSKDLHDGLLTGQSRTQIFERTGLWLFQF